MSQLEKTGSSPAYSLRDVLFVLFRRKRLILGFFATVVGVVTVGSFLIPPTYEATALILVNRARADVPVAPSDDSYPVIEQVTEEALNTEIQILASRTVIEGALKSIGVDETWRDDGLVTRLRTWLKAVQGREPLSVLDEAVLTVMKKLEVRPVRKSRVVSVSFRGKDPEMTARLVREITDKYLERRTRVLQSPQTVVFFEQEMDEAARHLRQTENEIEAFLSENDMTMMRANGGRDPLAAQKELELKRLGELQSQLTVTNAALREAEETVDALRSRLAAEPDRLESANRFNLDPAVEEIERSLVILQLRRDSLTQSFTEENAQVRDIDTQIRLAEERLNQARGRVENVNRTEPNPVHQEIKAELVRAQASLHGIRAKTSSLQREISAHRANLTSVNEKAFVIDRLNRERETAEEAYLLYRKKFEEAEISAAMDRQQIVNASVAQAAEVPLVPVSPRKTLALFLALVMGSVGGVALAFTAELFDNRFARPEDVERHLGIPVLASVGELESPPHRLKLLAALGGDHVETGRA